MISCEGMRNNSTINMEGNPTTDRCYSDRDETGSKINSSKTHTIRKQYNITKLHTNMNENHPLLKRHFRLHGARSTVERPGSLCTIHHTTIL